MAETDGIGRFLEGKTAGVPNLVILAIVGVGGGYLIYRSYRQQPSQATQTGTSGNLLASQMSPPPVTYMTGIPEPVTAPPTTPTSSTSSGCPPDTPVNPGDWYQTGAGWAFRGESFVKNCVMYTHTPNPAAFNAAQQAGVQQVFFTAPGVPVPIQPGSQIPGTGVPGLQGPTAVYTATPVGQGNGVVGFGQGGVASHGALSPWETFNQRWHAPQYVFGGLGAGPGAGASHLTQLAARMRLSPSRLMAANGHLRGRGWRASNRDVVRIA
jgi:hypothetical protein